MVLVFIIDKISQWYYGEEYSKSGLNTKRYPPADATDDDGFINSSMYLSISDD